jgi:hypothetical protein
MILNRELAVGLFGSRRIKAPPSEPLNLNGLAGDAKVDLIWETPLVSGSTSIFDYIVEYSIDGGNVWNIAPDNVSSNTFTTITGLVNLQSYLFRVAALNSIGQGPYSNIAGPYIPYAPTLVFNKSVSKIGMRSVPEFIEIVNSSSGPVTLDGWYIFNHLAPPDCVVETPERYTFPLNANNVLQAGENTRLYSGTGAGAFNSPPYSFVWDTSFKWSNDGDVADLYTPTNIWVDTLVLGGCLYDATGYTISYSNGEGNTLTSVPLMSAESYFEQIDLEPSPWTRGSGLTDAVGSTNNGWRSIPTAPNYNTLNEAVLANKSLDFQIKNNGLITYTLEEFNSFTAVRGSNGPNRVALVYNKTNDWSNYQIVADASLGTTTALRDTFNAGLSTLQPTLSFLETIYFRFVGYQYSGGNFGINGSSSSPQTIRFKAGTL